MMCGSSGTPQPRRDTPAIPAGYFKVLGVVNAGDLLYSYPQKEFVPVSPAIVGTGASSSGDRVVIRAANFKGSTRGVAVPQTPQGALYPYGYVEEGGAVVKYSANSWPLTTPPGSTMLLTADFENTGCSPLYFDSNPDNAVSNAVPALYASESLLSRTVPGAVVTEVPVLYVAGVKYIPVREGNVMPASAWDLQKDKERNARKEVISRLQSLGVSEEDLQILGGSYGLPEGSEAPVDTFSAEG